jgi:hypothetical protein
VLIRFDVDGQPVEFRRSWFTGRAELRHMGEVILLQNPLNPETHVSLSLTRTWTHRIGNHEVLIEKTRPLLFSAFRASDYRILVDGAVVAQSRGL